MTFRAVYTVWCDGPGGDRCASWIGQEEVRDDALRVALQSGWHRQNKMHLCPSCFAQISEPKSEVFKAYMIGANPVTTDAKDDDG